MKSSASEIIPILGTAMGGGFYVGRITINGKPFALVAAPKADGDRAGLKWNGSDKVVQGSLSFNDGFANTEAMAAAGSELAKLAREQRIGGHDDWYLPSVDELEIAYRNLKPTGRQNYCFLRSGINLSAMPPTHPYTPDLPVQTVAEAFKEGGEQAFADELYWTSTPSASNSYFAWCQHFVNGYQDDNYKSSRLRARFFRRLPI